MQIIITHKNKKFREKDGKSKNVLNSLNLRTKRYHPF